MSGIGVIVMLIQILRSWARPRRWADRWARCGRCGCAPRRQLQCPCHRRRHPDRGSALASQVDPVHAGAADCVDRRHAARGAGAARCAGDRAAAERSPAASFRPALGCVPGECYPAGPHSRAARLGGQSAYLPGRGLDNRHAAQRRPRADRPGDWQHGCRVDRRRSRRRGHHGNGDQHPRWRKDAGVGCVARGVRAGAAVGSRTLRRADSACRAGRDPDEGGLGHHRLADAHAHPPHPARAPDRDADHARPDGVRGPGDGGGDRAYRGGHGARASVGAAGARRRHVGADARPGVSRRHLARRVRSLLGAGGAGGVARQFHRGFLTQAGGGDQRRHQGS